MSHPVGLSTIAELAAATARAERAEAAEADLRATVERVRELHAPEPCEREHLVFRQLPWHDHEHCAHCGPNDAWPCPTITALDAQRPAEAGPERCPSKITNGMAVMQCVGRAEPFEHLHSAAALTWLSGDENELIETSSAASPEGEGAR